MNSTIGIHSLLNYIDSIKDALQVPTEDKITKDGMIGFLYCMNYLFGTNNLSYKASYDKIHTNTQLYNKMNPIGFRIKRLINDIDKNTYLIPYDIKYAIQDSGISPKKYNNTITNIITPGSYIDPCKRSNKGIIDNLNTIINESEFKLIGFSNVVKLSTTYQANNSCLISILLKNSTNISTLINNKFKPIGGDIDYFKGNSTKNKWFNNNIVSSTNITIGISYILCKELGDTMQSYYLKRLHEQEIYKNKVSLFTGDKLLTLRCRLFRVPVILSSISKDEYVCNFYPGTNSMTDSMKAVYYNQLMNHNNTVIENIHNVIINTEFIINTLLIKVNDNIETLLKNIIENINMVMDILKVLNTSDINYEEYRVLLQSLEAIHLFRKIGDKYSLHDNIIKLFPVYDNKLGTIKDIIAESKKTVSELILEHVIPEQKGGSYENIHIELDESKDFRIDREYGEEYDDELNTILCRKIYVILKDDIYKVKEDDKNNLIDILLQTYSIFNILYHYFSYTGGLIIRDHFLKDLINKYLDNHFKDYPISEFVKDYNDVADEIHEEEQKEEEETMKYIDDVLSMINKHNTKLNIYKNTRSNKRKLINVYGGKRKNKTIKKKNNSYK